MLFWGFFLFFLVSLIQFRQQGVVRKRCRRVSLPSLSNEETLELEQDVKEEADKVRKPNKDEVCQNAVVVNNLQCFRKFDKFDFNKHENKNVRIIHTPRGKIAGVFTVRGISFEVKYGERFVILGANSCGATPLFLSILGILEQVHGSIEVFGGLSNDYIFRKNKF